MNVSSGKVEHIAWLENDVNQRLIQLRLGKIFARKSRQLVIFERIVHSPSFATFQLQHKRLDVVIVRRKSLRTSRC